MGVIADAVNAQDLAGKVEAGDLLPAIVGSLVGLERARAHRENGLKIVAFPVQVLAFLQRFAALDDVIQLLDIVIFQGERQADTV